MKIELRHEALQLLHDQWGLLGEELREIWDGVQAVDDDLAQMFTGDMQSAYRAAAERSTAQASSERTARRITASSTTRICATCRT